MRARPCLSLRAPRRALSAAGLVLTLTAAAAGARGEPRWLRLSLLGDDPTGVGVTWNTLGRRTPPTAVVEYGLTPGRYEGRARGQVRRLGGLFGAQSEVALRGLQPETTYYYRAGDPRTGFGAEQRLRTRPAAGDVCTPVRFAFVGDSRAEWWEAARGTSRTWPALLARSAAQRVDVVLHGGDFVQDGKQAGQWVAFFDATERFSGRLPLMYALGNHDDGPGVGPRMHYSQLLQQPAGACAAPGQRLEECHAFEIGPALFVALSTLTTAGQGRPPFARQARWLDGVLARSRSRWKIVYLHHPIYTRAGWFGHPANEQQQNAAFVAVLNAHGVDLVLGSHNHFYERFAPSRCADPASSEPCPVAPGEHGTVYLTSGGGGARTLPFAGPTDATRPAAATAPHYVLGTISGGALTVMAIATSGRLLDRFTLRKPAPALACGGSKPRPQPPQASAGAPAPRHRLATLLSVTSAMLLLLGAAVLRRRRRPSR